MFKKPLRHWSSFLNKYKYWYFIIANKKLNILDFKHISKVTLSEDFPHTWPLHWVWDTYLTAMYAIVCVDPRLYFTPHSRSFPYTCKLLACTIGSSLQLKSSCLSPKHIVFSVYMKNNMHLTNPVSCVGNPFAYRKLFYFEEFYFSLSLILVLENQPFIHQALFLTQV